MVNLWKRVRPDGAAGVIWQDPDIVADTGDLEAMRKAARDRPNAVHVAIHKLWPASTMRDEWVYAHGIMNGTTPVLSQRLQFRAEWFALGLTYTPGRLLDLASPHMPAWVFGQVDSGLGAVARQYGIEGYAVAGATPKHLHFYPREDDASWRPGTVAPPR